jgi:hypothetical protein
MYLSRQRIYFQLITVSETSAHILHVRKNLRFVSLIMNVGENMSLNKLNFNYSVLKVRNRLYIGKDLKVFILWLLGTNSSKPTFR